MAPHSIREKQDSQDTHLGPKRAHMLLLWRARNLLVTADCSRMGPVTSPVSPLFLTSHFLAQIHGIWEHVNAHAMETWEQRTVWKLPGYINSISNLDYFKKLSTLLVHRFSLLCLCLVVYFSSCVLQGIEFLSPWCYQYCHTDFFPEQVIPIRVYGYIYIVNYSFPCLLFGTYQHRIPLEFTQESPGVGINSLPLTQTFRLNSPT